MFVASTNSTGIVTVVIPGAAGKFTHITDLSAFPEAPGLFNTQASGSILVQSVLSGSFPMTPLYSLEGPFNNAQPSTTVYYLIGPASGDGIGHAITIRLTAPLLAGFPVTVQADGCDI